MTPATKLVILDRDGVINHDSTAYIKSPREWRPIRGSLEAIARLRKGGYRVVVATNQAGIGRGLFDMTTLAAIHARMTQHVSAAGGRLDAIFFCPHAAEAGCSCRKPQPGMLHEIVRRFGVDASQVSMVGDSLRDLQAAAAAGCRPILVRTGNGEKTLKAGGLPEATLIRADLAEVALELAP
jgi:D-glycero-D-manno-heptose 1,7-bisphosphate phosphatase